MNRWYILLFFGLVLFSCSVNAAENCEGVLNGETVILTDCGFDCAGWSQSICTIPTSWFPLPAYYPECIGDDSFSETTAPGGGGDVLHQCGWNGTDCVNIFLDGDPNKVGSTVVSLVCFENRGDISDASCEFVRGSYVMQRRYCEQAEGSPHGTGYLKESTTQPNSCTEGSGDEHITLGPLGDVRYTFNMPNYDDDRRHGPLCVDYCIEKNGSVEDYGKCTDYGVTIPGTWLIDQDTICPKTTYDNICNGNDLQSYSCDGQQANPHLANVNWIDGLDVSPTPTITDCDVAYPKQDSICNPDCGTVFNTVTNACQGGKTTGQCSGSGSTANCSQISFINLDASETNTLVYYIDCDGLGLPPGTVNWSDSGDVGGFGQYSNLPVITEWTWPFNTPPFSPYNVSSDNRSSWDVESCGDDGGEYLAEDGIGGVLCCDNRSDKIVNIVDTIDDAIDMSGNYCYAPHPSDENRGCGDFVVDIDLGEVCDALYADYERWDIADLSNPVAQFKILILGDDSSCSGGEICSGCQCTTITPAVCGNDIIERPEEDCEPDPENLDGAECEDLGWDDGILACYPEGHAQECEFDTSGCFDDDPTNGGGGITTIYGNCKCPSGEDCSDGVGRMEIITIPLTGGPTVEFQECFLSEEEIPFFGWLTVLLALLIIIGFYFFRKNK